MLRERLSDAPQPTATTGSPPLTAVTMTPSNGADRQRGLGLAARGGRRADRQRRQWWVALSVVGAFCERFVLTGAAWPTGTASEIKLFTSRNAPLTIKTQGYMLDA